MKQVEGAAVIRAVVDLPRLSGRALLAALPIKIKEHAEQKAYDRYIAECLRLISANTAKYGGGSYIEVPFDELIAPPKPQEETGAVFKRIKEALRS